jgi:hypothetical protein
MKRANIIRIYTDKTRLRGFKSHNFSDVAFIDITSPPTPLLNKERGDKAQLCRGEVIICNLVLVLFWVVKRANRIRVYTDKTRLRGFKSHNFLLVHVGGLCLYSQASALDGFPGLKHLAREFYSLGLNSSIK